MVMTRPPAFHIWKFLMKNMTSPNSGLISVLVTFGTVATSQRCIQYPVVGKPYFNAKSGTQWTVY